MTFEDAVPLLEESFGFIFEDLEATEEVKTYAQLEEEGEQEAQDPMVITPYELEELKYAFEQSKLPSEERNAGQGDIAKGYHAYEPLSIASTRLVARKAGFAFTTVDHSPERVPVYAIGSGAAMFEGNFENIDIAYKLLAAMGLYEGGDTTAPQITVTGKAGSEEAATEEESTEESATEESATSEESATEESATEESATEESATEESATEEESAE